MAYAAKIYPESYLVQLLVGVSKGAGSGVVKIVEKVSFTFYSLFKVSVNPWLLGSDAARIAVSYFYH